MKPSKGLILFLVFSILGISFIFYAYQIVYTPNVLVQKEDRVIIIPKDATFKSVQKQLHDGRYVEDLMSFSFLARLMNYDKSIKPGRYVLKANMTNIEAIRLLRSGNQVPVEVTFNNIRTLDELGEKITRNLLMTPEEFKAALIQYALNNTEGFNENNIIALFIPNTYEVYYNITPEGLVQRMEREFNIFWNDERKAKAREIGLTPIEISILASIVQAETIKEDEAPLVASLYINRLKKDMPLQADPTLKFALGDFTIKRILNVHKEIDSPYNTYRYAGLPPGPINLAERWALSAVLNHRQTDYYYMCAKEDFSGYHNFSNSYRDHMVNAKRYQDALTREQRKAAQLKRNN
ncbi:MAG TPA: endolytic transglycosylase MltG [Cyclobacteriaceae bacterium]|nr:endolytic transglycosylase MltG [Cyclobacteriaceae bacterium]